MAKAAGKSRERGSIRRRGNSLQVLVYVGVDPLTGQRTYLPDSTTTKPMPSDIRTRLLAQVDEERHAKTKSTFRAGGATTLRVYAAWRGRIRPPSRRNPRGRGVPGSTSTRSATLTGGPRPAGVNAGRRCIVQSLRWLFCT